MHAVENNCVSQQFLEQGVKTFLQIISTIVFFIIVAKLTGISPMVGAAPPVGSPRLVFSSNMSPNHRRRRVHTFEEKTPWLYHPRRTRFLSWVTVFTHLGGPQEGYIQYSHI